MNTLLEVVTGVFFLFLLFSLIVSAINEAVLGHLCNLRSRVLEDSVHALLSSSPGRYSALAQIKAVLSWFATPGKWMISLLDWLLPGLESSPPKKWIGWIAKLRGQISSFNQRLTAGLPPRGGFSDALINHPVVQGLTVGNQRCPSYLPPQIFVDAVFGTLLGSDSGQGSPPSPDGQDRIMELKDKISQHSDDWAREVLGTLLIGAKNLDDARHRLETWFDQSMQRVSGVYKRYTQFWLYVWATVIVVCLNVDTIEITRRLLTDAQFRSTVAANAADFISRSNIVAEFALAPSSTNAAASTNSHMSVADLLKEINKLNLPIGWGVTNLVNTNTTNAPNATNTWSWSRVMKWPLLKQSIGSTNSVAGLLAGEVLSPAAPFPNNAEEWRLKILGLLITIAAVSQGAPFWFDLLSKLASLRAAGQPPPVKPKSSGTPGPQQQSS
jgi:hypothetical protein